MYYPYVFKELRFRYNRTLVNVFGIAVGIALFVSISAVSAAYKNAASRPFEDIGADLIVQRAEKKQAQPDKRMKSMRGIRLPFSNQLFDAQDLAALIKGVSISSSDSFLDLMGGVSMISEKFSFIASMVGLVGAALLIMKTMMANLIERSREIGILKTVGWTQQQIQRQLTAEAFVQTLACGLLGIIGGYCISFLLGFLSITIPVPWELNPVPAMARQAQAASQVVRLPVYMSLSLAVTAMGLSVIIGCICGYMLGRRTARMKPADLLRQL